MYELSYREIYNEQVETAVLFHDITGPSHNVTSTSARTTAARDYRPVMSKQLNEDDDVAEDAESTANDPSCDQYAAAEGIDCALFPGFAFTIGLIVISIPSRACQA